MACKSTLEVETTSKVKPIINLTSQPAVIITTNGD
jgi:hypothetical protein